MGLEINEELEKTRRFKTLMCEIHGNEERYFFNDGSEQGIRIVTFKEREEGIRDYQSKEFTMNINVDYY